MVKEIQDTQKQDGHNKPSEEAGRCLMSEADDIQTALAYDKQKAGLYETLKWTICNWTIYIKRYLCHKTCRNNNYNTINESFMFTVANNRAMHQNEMY